MNERLSIKENSFLQLFKVNQRDTLLRNYALRTIFLISEQYFLGP